jgi:hypothetical protein
MSVAIATATKAENELAEDEARKREESGPALCARGGPAEIVRDILRQATHAIVDHELMLECTKHRDAEGTFAALRIRLALNDIRLMAKCLGLMDLEGSYDPRSEREALALIMRGDSETTRSAPSGDEGPFESAKGCA